MESIRLGSGVEAKQYLSILRDIVEYELRRKLDLAKFKYHYVSKDSYDEIDFEILRPPSEILILNRGDRQFHAQYPPQLPLPQFIRLLYSTDPQNLGDLDLLDPTPSQANVIFINGFDCCGCVSLLDKKMLKPAIFAGIWISPSERPRLQNSAVYGALKSQSKLNKVFLSEVQDIKSTLLAIEQRKVERRAAEEERKKIRAAEKAVERAAEEEKKKIRAAEKAAERAAERLYFEKELFKKLK